jgi:activating signal cointegrator complex subunit 3
LSILDVLQIFGRAGRPQFDTNGLGIILTTHEKLQHYLSLLTRQNPIESQFISHLTDNLNAEIVLGTVSTVSEACSWLRYTYLNVRMHQSPITYGINAHMKTMDPHLNSFQRDLIIKAAQELDKAHMIRFEEKNEYLFATDLGRTASHYYINYVTIETINARLSNRYMSDGELMELLSLADEFSQLKIRDDELDELDLLYNNQCHLPVKGGSENVHGKVNILIQSFVSRAQLTSFSLISDMSYVNQNVIRLIRALFEVVLKRSWATLSSRLLRLAKIVEQRMWDTINPLWQFSQYINIEILQKLDAKQLTPDRLLDMEPKDIGIMIQNARFGKEIKAYASYIPLLRIETQLQPITRTVLRIKLTITAQFKWSDKIHGNNGQQFWIWIEDPDTDNIYHSEYFILTKKQVKLEEPQILIFTIPIIEPLANQYYVRAISDKWLGSDTTTIISFQNLILPERHMPHTGKCRKIFFSLCRNFFLPLELLDLDPLPITALGNPEYESLFKFKHFNPIQTQLFHCLYHTNNNTLLGSPTGSGKTVAAEIAMFRVFNKYPGMKCVYIAPLKALVRERIQDWKIRFEERLGKKVVELTGDFTPDTRAIQLADVIVTTPEKWDGMSRSWQTRSYVKDVALLIIDEIHMLGEDRGPVLEVIVSRTNFIASHTERALRIIGLSTAVANARDLADWLGITGLIGLYNFRPSVRPVPLEAHIQGYPGKHYCPRCMSMNKPAYQAIRTHSPNKPVLIFVSSRRQTRLTAEELTKYLLNDDHPRQWLHMPEYEMNNLLAQIQDKSLRLTLSFGIGIHHAGLKDRDRHIVEELFVNQKIQILVATVNIHLASFFL